MQIKNVNRYDLVMSLIKLINGFHVIEEKYMRKNRYNIIYRSTVNHCDWAEPFIIYESF